MDQRRSPSTIRQRARSLRRAPTPAEAAAWQLVRASRLGPRFRRQQPLGPYIADFFCAEARLVIELDGPQHGDDPARDARRDRWLESQGIRVLRFRNEDVLGDVQPFLQAVRQALAAPHPSR